ncbi:MAG TPA: Ig-like domain-containing protein, partial [Candidatus Angelobacter sp.]|nr:Ig-like domain-containing protein [Candidatus Angelobacter sp.]
MSPQTSAVAAGLTQQFTATGSFSDGTSKPITSVTWSSSDTTLATVSSTGLATTLKQGSVNISASSGTVKGNTSLVIGPAQAKGLVISPATPNIILGAAATTQLSALVTFTDSSTVDVSATATWSSSNPTVATVNSTGAVTPARLGYTKITAISGAFTATADAPVVSIPRYLYIPTDTGRTISKGIIDPVDGHVRMGGYIATQSTNGIFPCATVDPTQQFLYVASSINNGALSGEVQMY